MSDEKNHETDSDAGAADVGVARMIGRMEGRLESLIQAQGDKHAKAIDDVRADMGALKASHVKLAENVGELSQRVTLAHAGADRAQEAVEELRVNDKEQMSLLQEIRGEQLSRAEREAKQAIEAKEAAEALAAKKKTADERRERWIKILAIAIPAGTAIVTVALNQILPHLF